VENEITVLLATVRSKNEIEVENERVMIISQAKGSKKER